MVPPRGPATLQPSYPRVSGGGMEAWHFLDLTGGFQSAAKCRNATLKKQREGVLSVYGQQNEILIFPHSGPTGRGSCESGRGPKVSQDNSCLGVRMPYSRPGQRQPDCCSPSLTARERHSLECSKKAKPVRSLVPTSLTESFRRMSGSPKPCLLSRTAPKCASSAPKTNQMHL